MKKTTKFIALLVAITMLFGVMSTLLSSSVYAEEPIFCSVNGTVEYETVAAAIEATDSGTITLDSDVTEDITISDGKNITLDLGGYTLNGKFDIKGGAVVTIQNGTIASGALINWIYASGSDDKPTTFVLAEDATIVASNYGLCICGVTGSSDYNGTGFMITINGTIETTASNSAGIFAQGNMRTTTASVCDVIVNGTVKGGSEGWGIANNGWCNTIINEGAEVSGGVTGIEIRAGSLTVNGGTISGGTEGYESTGNTSGTTSGDAGIAIAEHTTDMEITVTINDGEISGYYAVAQSNPNNKDNHVTLTIYGGTFISTDASIMIEEDATDATIYCGFFSDDTGIEKYLAEGAIIDENGDVHSYGEGVVVAPTCEEDGYTYYTCEYCGHTYSDSYVEALGHKWNGGVVTKEATEDEDGEITYTCLNDPTHTYTEVIPALGSEEEDVNKSDSGEAEDVTDEGTSVLPNTGDIVLGAWVALIVVAGVAFAFTFKKSRK